MDLIDRYVTAVGKHLPRKNRADIEAEIRSTLMEMLEDRSRESGRAVEEADVKEVLLQYGAPDTVAATYLPQRFLIGPRMFPIFWLIFRIVFAVLTTLAVIGLGIRLAAGPANLQDVFLQIGSALLEYFQGIAAALGSIVLVMAVIERFTPEEKIAAEWNDEQTWTPDMLLAEPDPNEVKARDLILGIVFNAIALALFNFLPQFLINTPGLVDSTQRSLFIVPVLSEAFYRYLPWINLVWGLEIVLNLVLLRTMRWTTATRVMQLALKGFGIVVAIAMLVGPSLLGLTTADLTSRNIGAVEAAELVNLIGVMIRVGLAIAIVAGGFDLAKTVYQMVTQPMKSSRILQ